MHYLSKDDLLNIGIKWNDVIDRINDAVLTLKNGDFAQPIKPYLRFRNLTNRIIAMPAYVGGNVSFAGIKWIASFPDNINKNIPRANSVTILNDADTGVPVCIVNTSFISAVRTAAVTGLVVRQYLAAKTVKEAKVGMTGFGPIGQLHLQMIGDLLGDNLKQISIYDLRPIDQALIPDNLKDKVRIVNSWEEAFDDADIFMTCTVSKAPYINKKPKPGSLQLNVSLRDYVADFVDYTQIMIVDDWEEICRENTDIEVMHKTKGLQEKDTHSLANVVTQEILKNAGADDVIMFNPMGMAVFDIATAAYYYDKAQQSGIGTVLAD